MFWWLVAFPVGFMVIVIVTALLLGKRDRKKQLQQIEEDKQNLMKNNPKQAATDHLQQYKDFSEYLLTDVQITNKEIKGNIDILYLSKKGIFVIAVLGNSGDISGDLNGEYWVDKVNEEYALKNPFPQNEKLLKSISNITNENINLYNIVIVPNAKSINIANNDDNVVKLSEFFPMIREYPDVYSDNDLMVIYNLIDNHIHRIDND